MFIIAIECGLVSIFCTVVFWSSNIYLGQLLTVESNYRWVLQTAECETYTETYTPWTQKDSKNIWPVESTATMVLTSRGRFPMIDHQIMGILMRKIMRSYDLKRPGLILAAHIYIYVCVYLFMSLFFYANKQIGYMINFDQALSILLRNSVEHHHYNVICFSHAFSWLGNAIVDYPQCLTRNRCYELWDFPNCFLLWSPWCCFCSPLKYVLVSFQCSITRPNLIQLDQLQEFQEQSQSRADIGEVIQWLVVPMDPEIDPLMIHGLFALLQPANDRWIKHTKWMLHQQQTIPWINHLGS